MCCNVLVVVAVLVAVVLRTLACAVVAELCCARSCGCGRGVLVATAVLWLGWTRGFC